MPLDFHGVLYTVAAQIVPLLTGVVGLYYSTLGYQKTKFRGFLYWIWASCLGLAGDIALLIVYTPPSGLSKLAYHGLWVFWCLSFSAAGLLGTWGLILLVKHFVAHFSQSSGSVTAGNAE